MRWGCAGVTETEGKSGPGVASPMTGKPIRKAGPSEGRPSLTGTCAQTRAYPCASCCKRVYITYPPPPPLDNEEPCRLIRFAGWAGHSGLSNFARSTSRRDVGAALASALLRRPTSTFRCLLLSAKAEVPRKFTCYNMHTMIRVLLDGLASGPFPITYAFPVCMLMVSSSSFAGPQRCCALL